jgi:hypothetical protein
MAVAVMLRMTWPPHAEHEGSDPRQLWSAAMQSPLFIGPWNRDASVQA